MENAEYETVNVLKKIIDEARSLMKKSQEEGNPEWQVCMPFRTQQIVDVALAEFLEHLREDVEE